MPNKSATRKTIKKVKSTSTKTSATKPKSVKKSAASASPQSSRSKVKSRSTSKVASKKSATKKKLTKKSSTKKSRVKKSSATKSPKLSASKKGGIKSSKTLGNALLKNVTTNTKKSKKTTSKKTAAKKAKVETVEEEPMAAAMAESMAAAMFASDFMNEDEALARQAEKDSYQRELCERLAVSQTRYDELANIELAADIVFNFNHSAIDALVRVIESRDDVHSSDAAKVIAEVASRDADLVEPELDRLLVLLDDESPFLRDVLFAVVPLADRVAEEMTDHIDLLWSIISETESEASNIQLSAVKVLSAMCAASPDQARVIAGGLVDLLGKCLPADVSAYAETILPALGDSHIHRAKPVLDRRMKELAPAEVARLRRAMRSAGTISRARYSTAS